MIDHAKKMRGQRAERVVVTFLGDLLKVQRAREQLELEMLTFSEDIPFYFYAVRQACGRMTQLDLADYLGVNHSYVSKVENGHLMPKAGHLDSILDLLRLNGFTWEGEPFTPTTSDGENLGSAFEAVWRREKPREKK